MLVDLLQNSPALETAQVLVGFRDDQRSSCRAGGRISLGGDDEQVAALRDSGLASTRRHESSQIVAALVRRMGELLLQPLVDATWDRVANKGDGPKPRLSVTMRDDEPPSGSR